MSKDIFVCYLDPQEYGSGYKKNYRALLSLQGVNKHYKPKFKLQAHLALQQDILSESAFYKIRCRGLLSLKRHLGNRSSHYGGCAMTVIVQGYF